MQQKEIIKMIKDELHKLSNLFTMLSIVNWGDDFDGEDLNKSYLIFFFLLGDLTTRHHKGKLNEKGLKLILEEFQKNIEQSIELGTGINMEMLNQRLMNRYNSLKK